MTKKERAVLQAFFNRMSEFRDAENEAFAALQNANGLNGDGHRWCCAQTNYEGLLKQGHTKYGCQYNKYVEAGAKISLLTELRSELANLGFWKGEGK